MLEKNMRIVRLVIGDAVDAAWAQAYLTGAAILVSGILAVLVPYWERRSARKREESARLDITTTRWPSDGLRLEIAYRPEFTNMGISATISVRSSDDARLILGRPSTNPVPMGNGSRIRHEMAGPFIGNSGQVRLLPLDDYEVFTGVVFLLPSDASKSGLQTAHISVRILTAAGGELLKHELIVSPIDSSI
jgi:hypothetical protein